MPNPIVVDLSHHNPTPDWQALKAGGTLGVILKATEGASYVDPTFASRWDAAKANGLLRSAYHFLRPGNMLEQMQRFIKVVQPSLTERLVIDYEDPDVSFANLQLAAKFLLDAGYQVAIYGSNVLTDACKGKTSAILSNTSLWQARYSSNEPEVPSIWPTWALWQFTDKAKVSGIKALVDGNHWNGHPANLPAWFDSSLALPPSTPYPEPAAEPVTIEMVITGGVKVLINGRYIDYDP